MEQEEQTIQIQHWNPGLVTFTRCNKRFLGMFWSVYCYLIYKLGSPSKHRKLLPWVRSSWARPASALLGRKAAGTLWSLKTMETGHENGVHVQFTRSALNRTNLWGGEAASKDWTKSNRDACPARMSTCSLLHMSFCMRECASILSKVDEFH